MISPFDYFIIAVYLVFLAVIGVDFQLQRLDVHGRGGQNHFASINSPICSSVISIEGAK
jgi:hypothetical protein